MLSGGERVDRLTFLVEDRFVATIPADDQPNVYAVQVDDLALLLKHDSATEQFCWRFALHGVLWRCRSLTLGVCRTVTSLIAPIPLRHALKVLSGAVCMRIFTTLVW